MLVPVWAEETTGSAATVGLVFATFGGAAALGSICAAAWAERLPRYRTYLIAFLVCGAPRFVVFALDTPMWAVLARLRGRRLRRRASSTRSSAR